MGMPPSAQSCDTRKGEASIALNPLDPAHTSTLRCSNRGYLESTDRIFQEDIDEQRFERATPRAVAAPS